MSRTLVVLALVVASCTSTPYKMSDDLNSSFSPNDVSFERFRGIKKIGQSLEARSNEDIGEQTVSEMGDDEALRVSSKVDLYGQSTKKGRKHKVFFRNYPFLPQIRRRQSNSQILKNRNDLASTEYKPGHRKRLQQDSQIYYIRLPPTPYMYVPGLGYISQPPTYSTASLQRPVVNNHHVQRPMKKPQKPTVKPFINVPIDFVSNGKPTGVYQWAGGKKQESSLNSLNEGPYVFNGKPTSLYLLTPDGQKTGHQPIRLPDYSAKGYY